MLKPWMIVNHRGYVLCLMCPMDKTVIDRKSGATIHYYRGIRPKKVTRKRYANWLRAHRRCGFEGLMQ